MLRRK
jgi:Family of unknown function (DUF6152)